MPSPATVLALFAHPDDAEFLCAGTLAHLAERGASVHIVTMTAGDCGSAILPPEKITRVRKSEATRAAGLIGAAYACLGPAMRNTTEDQFVAGMKARDVPRGRFNRVAEERTSDGGEIVFYTVQSQGPAIGYIVYLNAQGLVVKVE